MVETANQNRSRVMTQPMRRKKVTIVGLFPGEYSDEQIAEYFRKFDTGEESYAEIELIEVTNSRRDVRDDDRS